MAAGWRIFKVAEADAKANVLYVHVMLPAIRGVDYRPSIWLDKLLGGAPPELLAKYRDACRRAQQAVAGGVREHGGRASGELKAVTRSHGPRVDCALNARFPPT